MTKFEMIDKLVASGNGYLQTATVVKSGISKPTLAEYVKKRNMERVGHGVYAAKDTWPDPFYLVFLRNKRIIFSFDTAIYLHDLSDREPFYITVTVPSGYNDKHLRNSGIKVVHAKSEWYGMGASTIITNCGNTVPVYDMERTICDLIRCKKDIEIQTFQTALREYMRSKGKNLSNLMKYAETFGISDEVRTYTEVML